MSDSSPNKFLAKLYAHENNRPSNEITASDPIATPSPSLNWSIDGGIRPGGFYCFEGPESSGKSFIALCCVAELLKKDKDSIALWFDAEGAFSVHFLNILLPDVEDQKRLVVASSKGGMKGTDIFDYFNSEVLSMAQDGLKIAAVVVDSLQMIIAPKEANLKSTGDHLMGDLSSYLPKALRLISGPSKPRLKEGFVGIPWIFISQVRDNLDPSAAYTGKKYNISGGRAFRHALDVEILFEIIESKKTRIYGEEHKNMNDSAVQIGHRVRSTVQKNKFGPPKRVAEFDLIYDVGIVNQAAEIASLGIRLGLITKDGITYYYGTEKLAVGEPKTIELLASRPDIQDKIMFEVFNKKPEAINVSIQTGQETNLA